jgi:hypothetical protein
MRRDGRLSVQIIERAMSFVNSNYPRWEGDDVRKALNKWIQLSFCAKGPPSHFGRTAQPIGLKSCMHLSRSY